MNANTQYVVTIRKADGYVFNHKVIDAELRDYLQRAAAVLLEGETLTFKLGAAE